ncbi:MAG: hypothetical protein HYR63_25535 [Proteobacteria bacterium]|nr:hypothetical protein [Pseudomonadota bacterium]MBI3497294.1 hypothetical protein [Pseudomonadota bacterium]
MARLRLTLVVLVASLSAAISAAAQIGPGRQQSCFLVRNVSQVMLFGRVVTQSRERYTFRLGKGESTRGCLAGVLFKGDRVQLVIVSLVTVPLFECYTTIDQPIQLYARRKQEGWDYSADCR